MIIGKARGKRILVKIWKVEAPKDRAFRIGGDEFGILLDNIQEPGDALRVVNRIMDAAYASARNGRWEQVATAPSAPQG